jgi:hypothetical protein
MQLRVAENMANPQVLKLVLHIATIPLLPDLRPLQPVDEKFYHSTDQVMPCLAAKPPNASVRYTPVLTSGVALRSVAPLLGGLLHFSQSDCKWKTK